MTNEKLLGRIKTTKKMLPIRNRKEGNVLESYNEKITFRKINSIQGSEFKRNILNQLYYLKVISPQARQ